jgi:hypothetical protein
METSADVVKGAKLEKRDVDLYPPKFSQPTLPGETLEAPGMSCI